VVEDRVQVEVSGLLVGGEQAAQGDTLVLGALREFLDDAVGVVAVMPRCTRASRSV
jgi:hypothetical protein